MVQKGWGEKLYLSEHKMPVLMYVINAYMHDCMCKFILSLFNRVFRRDWLFREQIFTDVFGLYVRD